MQALLIDKNGEVWSAGSFELRQRYDAWCSPATFENFLIRNNSFIRVQVSERSVDVRLAPARLTTRSLARLGEILEPHGSSRIVVRWFAGRWQERICPGRDHALREAARLASECRPSEVDKYLAQPRDPATLDERHPLFGVLDIWRQNSGRLFIDDYPRIVDDHLQRRYVTAFRDPKTSRLLFSRIGEGYKMYHSSWAHHLIGQRVEDQPDVRYARWVGDRWREAMLAGQPMLCEADVIIEDPVSEASRRIQYLRLTLPIIDANGEDGLLSASVSDPSVNLRVEVDHEPENVVD